MGTSRALLVVAALGVAACSLGEGQDVSSVPPLSASHASGAGSDDAGAPASHPPSPTPSPTSTPTDAASPLPAPSSAPEAGASGCSGAVVCEDFEAYAAGPLALPDAGSLWQIETPSCSGTGTLAIDATEAHSGARSLKVTGAAGYCNHVFLGTNAVASLTGQVWARFYVRLTTALTSDHATFLAMRDTSTSADLRMGGQDAVLMWNRESDDATLPAMSPQGTALSVVPSVAAWHCIELSVNATIPTLQTWVDGVLVTGLVAGGSAAVAAADGQWVSTAWAPHVVDARFGWESYANEAETLWFDDVAIGPVRIGCGG
jgi:hypothetical protein